MVDRDGELAVRAVDRDGRLEQAFAVDLLPWHVVVGPGGTTSCGDGELRSCDHGSIGDPAASVSSPSGTVTALSTATSTRRNW